MQFDDPMRLIEDDAFEADAAFRAFREQQLRHHQDIDASAKNGLKEKLNKLDERLNGYLAHEYGIDNDKPKKLEAWKVSHKPFHWFVDFYGIMKSGGFDVVVGNPPYIEYVKVKSQYTVKDFHTEQSGNLYCFCAERSQVLTHTKSWHGLIIPIAITSVNETKSVRNYLAENNRTLWISNFAIRPAKLFDGVEQRLTIAVGRRGHDGLNQLFSSKYHQWFANERPFLFHKLAYVEIPSEYRILTWPKIGSDVEIELLDCLEKLGTNCIAQSLVDSSANLLVFHRTPGYWIRMMNFEPYFKSPSANRSIHHIRLLYAKDKESSAIIGSIIGSSFYFWWFFALGNCRNLTLDDVRNFPTASQEKHEVACLVKLFSDLMKNYQSHSSIKRRGEADYQEFDWSQAKSTIDVIDKTLSTIYGFSEAALDFITSYDIKVRLGAEATDD